MVLSKSDEYNEDLYTEKIIFLDSKNWTAVK